MGNNKKKPNMNPVPPDAAELWVLGRAHKISEPQLPHLEQERTGLYGLSPSFQTYK